MQHNIDINVINNSVGIPPDTDGVMGIFIQAVAVANTFNLNQAYLLTGMDDLTALGIDATYDSTNGTAVYQQVSEFYAQAGDGALLWLIGVAKNTAFAAFVAGNTFDTLIRFTAQADPDMRVKMIGICYAPPTAAQSATDFPADVPATITALQLKQQQLFQSGYQFSAIVDGYNMSDTVTPATLGTEATNTAFAVSLCITGTQPNGVSAVGLALGRFARITAGTGFGELEDAAGNQVTIAATQAFLTNSVIIPPAGPLIVGQVYTVFGGKVTYNAVDYLPGQQFTCVVGHTVYTTLANGYVANNVTPVGDLAGSTIVGLSDTDFEALGGKQLMFLRTWFATAGFYWNDAATCNPTTKALSSQEYNRVANHLSAAALAFFIRQMNKNLPLDKTTGNVAQGWLTTKQEEFFDTYIQPMIDSGDITTATLTVTGVNFLATKTLSFTLQIVPTVILGSVTGTVQFVAKL